MTVAHDPWVHTFEMTLPGDPARVFAALTTPEPLMRWFADHVQVELREGGRVSILGPSLVRHAQRRGGHTASDAPRASDGACVQLAV